MNHCNFAFCVQLIHVPIVSYICMNLRKQSFYQNCLHPIFVPNEVVCVPIIYCNSRLVIPHRNIVVPCRDCKELVFDLYSMVRFSISFIFLCYTNLYWYRSWSFSKRLYIVMEGSDVFDNTCCSSKSVSNAFPSSKSLNSPRKNVGNTQVFSPEHWLQKPFASTTRTSRWKNERSLLLQVLGRKQCAVNDLHASSFLHFQICWERARLC